MNKININKKDQVEVKYLDVELENKYKIYMKNKNIIMNKNKSNKINK